MDLQERINEVLEGNDFEAINFIPESFEEVDRYMDDNDYLSDEIIYYAAAMEYLTENDTSLSESLALASEMGYSLENLDSEVLATLLARQKKRELFYSLEDEITDLIDGYEYDEEDE